MINFQFSPFDQTVDVGYGDQRFRLISNTISQSTTIRTRKRGDDEMGDGMVE